MSPAQSGTPAGKEDGHLLQEKLWRMVSEDAYETSPHGGSRERIITLSRQHCGGWR